MVRKAGSTFAKVLLFLAVFSLSFTHAYAYEPEEPNKTENAEKKGSFDAGKLIIDHISDSYGWHLWGEGHSSVSIPLPVILYTDKGLDVFMSSAFHHGEE